MCLCLSLHRNVCVSLLGAQEIQTQSIEIELRESQSTVEGLKQELERRFHLAAGVLQGVYASLHGIEVSIEDDNDVVQLQDGDEVIVRIGVPPRT
jgi:hypothetical protein